MTATITVFTYKAGMLSRVAHDLKFQVQVALGSGPVRIDPKQLRLVCTMKRGSERPVSAKDRRSIEQNLQQDVLESARFPDILFESGELDAWQGTGQLRGHLELHGVRKPLTLNFRAGLARLKLHQPDYGIRPFSAMMGALKIKPGVEVEVSISAP